MKFILIAFISVYGRAGNAPIMTSAEFDDRPACEAAVRAVKEISGSSVDARCLPKGSGG